MLKKYWNERTLNPYYYTRGPHPKMLATCIMGMCGAWIFFYSVQMNFVTGTDCYALEQKDGTWINHSGAPSNTTPYTKFLNISYKFRLMCVLGVTIWS